MHQFSRTLLLLGEEKFQWLRNSNVTVVGLGAVGSYAVEALSRFGIGHLRLIDFDKVEISNLNRQLYALHSTLGQPKAQVAKQRVLDINPEIKVETLEVFVNRENLPDLLSNSPHLVVDAIDSLSSKIDLLHFCYTQKIPVVSSMGAALRQDPSKIETDDIMNTRHCPLARRVRQELRKRGVKKGITCVYSTEKIDPNARKTVKRFIDPDGKPQKILGSLPTLTGIFGLTLAQIGIESLIER